MVRDDIFARAEEEFEPVKGVFVVLLTGVAAILDCEKGESGGHVWSRAHGQPIDGPYDSLI